MKATAVAPANIAFIKYWGKKDASLRLPLNASLSMNLSDACTTTTVEFDSHLNRDTVVFLDVPYKSKWPRNLYGDEIQRVIDHLDRMRNIAGISMRAQVMTINTFPKSSGIASSASGFAALTVAAAAALGLQYSEKELSILARLGSGSACRSIPDGFVLWEEGELSETSFARSIFSHDWWDVRDIVIVVASGKKEISSAAGMEQVNTSPKLSERLAAVPNRIKRAIDAIANKDIQALGNVIEEDCLDMHAVMQSQVPALYYWTEETKQIMDAVGQWRREGLAVYFTIDAGPNVHLVCEGKQEKRVLEKIKELSGVERLIVNKSARGAHLIDTHLF